MADPVSPAYVGYWLCFYSAEDWSSIAVFRGDQELEARRYAMNNGMLCEYRKWGEVKE